MRRYIHTESNMKKLYAVSIERTVMVMAESENEAEQLATTHERDELCNDADFVSANLVTGLSQIHEPWRECIPYGGDDDQNCQQIFDSLQGSASSPPSDR